MKANSPVFPAPPAARRQATFTRRSLPARMRARVTGASHFGRRPKCNSPRLVDLTGRAVRLADDIPTVFDGPLSPQHRLIGTWVGGHHSNGTEYTRSQARRRIERAFATAVSDILEPVVLADLRVSVRSDEAGDRSALAVNCDSLGQLDLGWIEDSDAPIPWRATAYSALERMLGRVLPVFGYGDLFDAYAAYNWEGETDDEWARQALIELHGVSEQDLDGQILPSTMNADRPPWMIAENAVGDALLPRSLNERLDRVREAHDAVGASPSDCDAWHVEQEILFDYMPELEECFHLPPLTIVPLASFADELDDITRHGMEAGFTDVAGLYPLPDASRIDDWLASLRLGARFLCAVQDLLAFDPTQS
ncbi:hypothetical protein QE360_003545 [Sphingomonas sp. SORGH_AS789]|nr:hypothetical protein [Sphingomonas sp. SORGH_AS_0789]MDR6149747.1 hypothetical protein [Sphingomonas sp. SORGH_AS_0742]